MLKIKEIRKEKNYTQKDLANFLNKSITTICDWERGRTEPSTDDLISKNFQVLSRLFIRHRK